MSAALRVSSFSGRLSAWTRVTERLPRLVTTGISAVTLADGLTCRGSHFRRMMEPVALLRKLVRTLVGLDSGTALPPEVVIWPAASNDRRLVAVCSRCNKALRSGFTAEAVRGPYNHTCDPTDFIRRADNS